jgi:hypothetical protein
LLFQLYREEGMNRTAKISLVALAVLMLVPSVSNAKWALRVGVHQDFKSYPENATNVGFGTEDQFHIVGPLSLAFGTRMQVGKEFFGWLAEFGALVKLTILPTMKLSLRAMFIPIGGKHYFYDKHQDPYYWGFSVGPGLLFSVGGIELGVEAVGDFGRCYRPYQVTATSDERWPIMSFFGGIILVL